MATGIRRNYEMPEWMKQIEKELNKEKALGHSGVRYDPVPGGRY